ncbi:MAG: hypothetical protein QS98_C0011G0081 [archaeon GW2011_AR3]|nr:MAG: hypothetical protein QS98_C0011G0081 [archaeon GW2011_AR3]MBS3109654.1 hypothetical protein [Candidatus Woesearchaeota archaeon]
MKYVLCFGNPYVKDDSLAQQTAKRLKLDGIEMVSCNSPEEIMFYMDKDFAILDVATGIKEAQVISDLAQLESSKMVSLHDFDLAFFLKLLKKLNTKSKVRLIAVPAKYPMDKLEKRLKLELL